MAFRGYLETRWLRRIQKRKLLKNFTYITKDKEKIIMKKSFCFDGASIPKIFWSIAGSPFTGKYVESSCLHDYCYYNKLFSRKKCDRIFEEAMEECGVSLLKRKSMYWAVRLFGSWGWKK